MKKSIMIGAVCMAAVASQAAPITWQDSVGVYADAGGNNDTFVKDNGTSVLAVSGHNVAGTVFNLNGVTFTSVDAAGLNTGHTDNGVTLSTSTVMGDAAAFGDGSFSSNGDIYNLLHGGLYNPTTVNLSGLTDGQEYQIQIFVNDSRNGRHSDYETGFSDGVNTLADSITLGTVGRASLSNRSPVDGTGEPSGDYIIGTFIADATGVLSFDINGSTDGSLTNSGGRAQINGLSLQAIPEPATLGLVAAFGGSVLFIRRRFMI